MALSAWTSCFFWRLLLLTATARTRGRGVEAIRAVAGPVHTAAVAGQAAELSCSVADKSANEILTWRLRWDRDDTVSRQSVYLTAEDNATTFEFDESVVREKHATYTTKYTVNGTVHTTVLHIADIQPSDAGSVACEYQITVGGSVIARTIPGYEPVRLTVWTPPAPTCSYANLDPNTTANGSPTTGATVELVCADTFGVPAPEITWRADERNSTGVNVSVYRHGLRDEDNGRWFECQASGPATQDPVICRVQPMAVAPTAHVTPAVLNITEGDSIELVCTGSGLPHISSYHWFLDTSPTHAADSKTYSLIRVTNTATASVLTVDKVSKLGRTIVSCEVMVSTGLAGRASGAVMVSKQPVTMTPAARDQARPGQQLGMAPSAFAIPLGCLFFLLILMVVLFVRHHQLRRHSHSYSQKLSPDTAGMNGEAPIQNKRAWKVYRVTTV